MNELKVVSVGGKLLTSSLDVSKMISRPHSDLLKSIRGYAVHLTKGNFPLSEFFIEDTYEDSTGRKLPSFYLTRKGCDMVANKMTGENGVLFTAAYVTKFAEMETKQPRILTEREQLKASMKLSLETSEEVEEIKKDVNMLKETMRIDGSEEFRLRTNANVVVVAALGGKKSNAYRNISRSVFPKFWNEFKRYFEIPRYGDLPKKQFDRGIEFIRGWTPDTITRMEIDELNSQQEMEWTQ